MIVGIRRVVGVALLSLLCWGCAAAPEERLALASAAAADKNLESFTKVMTRDSGIFLRNAVENQKRSRFEYLKDPFDIIPEGDVAEMTIEGKVAILKLAGKRGPVELRMFMENDEWSLDIFSLPDLWKPLGGTP
jgi:hypothetical protein